MKTNNKLLIIPAFFLVATLGFSAKASAESLTGSLGVGVSAHSANINANVNGDVHSSVRGDDDMHDMAMNGIFGTVTAINGSTITVSSKAWTKPASGSTAPTTTTYTVNTSSSTTVDKNRAASSVSGIAVGDNIMVQGTVNGTTVTAASIHDGVMAKGNIPTPGSNGEATLPQGNGQPIIGGSVTAVSGNTVTITNKSNVSYTIDVANAKITKSGTTAAVSNIAVGDQIIAQGTINGNSVTAVNVVDSTNASASTSTTTHRGFFGAIGNFFSKLFGF